MKVSIIGLGWFGKPMALELLKMGYEIRGTTRTADKKSKLENEGLNIDLLNSPALPGEKLLSADILIINIPPLDDQLEWLKRWPLHKDSWIIFISSTGGRDILLETEKWIMSNFRSWTILRFAGLLGPDRHPGKTLSGKKDIKGQHWPVNLLHQEDAIGFTCEVIRQGIKSEVINVICDEHHSKEEFYTEYARRMNLPLPQFDPADESLKPALENKRAREIYNFKWPKLIGKAL